MQGSSPGSTRSVDSLRSRKFTRNALLLRYFTKNHHVKDITCEIVHVTVSMNQLALKCSLSNLQDERRLFDIHIYGREVLDRLDKLDGQREPVLFSKVVEGKMTYDVCRYFLASLQLVCRWCLLLWTTHLLLLVIIRAYITYCCYWRNMMQNMDSTVYHVNNNEVLF